MKYHKARKHGHQYPDVFPCKTCTSVYQSEGALLQHEPECLARRKETHMCEVCGKTFRVIKYGKCHIHAKNVPISFTFQDIRKKEQHFVIAHTTKKLPWPCDLCPKTFREERHLLVSPKICCSFEIRPRKDGQLTNSERPYF